MLKMTSLVSRWLGRLPALNADILLLETLQFYQSFISLPGGERIQAFKNGYSMYFQAFYIYLLILFNLNLNVT